jgi:hypothetical protein
MCKHKWKYYTYDGKRFRKCIVKGCGVIQLRTSCKLENPWINWENP